MYKRQDKQYIRAIAEKHSMAMANALQIIASNIPHGEAGSLFKADRLTLTHYYLLPAQRVDGLTGRLRSRNKYPTVRARTNRFKNSFIPYAIANYQ